MSDEKTVGIHWSFWVIAVFALIWNALGSVNFFMQLDSDFVATLPETHRAIIIGRPLWATGGFAVGVLCGALGGLLLLFRKMMASYLFVASLLGVIVTMFHTINIASSVIDFSLVEIAVMIVMPLLVAAALLWYTKRARIKPLLG